MLPQAEPRAGRDRAIIRPARPPSSGGRPATLPGAAASALLDPMLRLHPAALAACVSLSASAFALAQAPNVAVLGTYNPGEYTNDIWGYVDPATGKEYALLLTRSNALVLDCSNPASPALRGTIPRSLSGWSRSTWRDARTFRHYMYVVTEGGGGMQIVDLSNPDSPVFLRTHTIPGVSWTNTHNISIDVDAGICYAVGTSGGMHVMDLNADPVNPRHLTSYTAEYVHDMQAQDGLAYLAEYNRRTFRILDVRNLPAMPLVGSAFLNAAHTSFPTRDGRFVVGTSETFGGGITVFDATNPASPGAIATWRTGGSQTSVHNAFLRDRLVHMSYYSEGYQVLDLSDPTQPVSVGHHDSNVATGGYDGAWGCYPFQPSGNVYLSDTSNGLLVLRPTAVPTPYGTATPGSGGAAPKLHSFGAAFLGNARFGLEVEAAPPLAGALFLVGTAALNLGYQGLTLLVDTTIGAVAATATDADGRASTPVPVPNDPNLLGQTIHAQCFVQDAGGPLGFTATAGLAIRPFQR
jgi:choice-of-anchor B domain-containing protein